MTRKSKKKTIDAYCEFENEEYDEGDELTPIDKRYQLNKYI